jgi:Fur family transcriptional regulator, peroxide stress response regulator
MVELNKEAKDLLEQALSRAGQRGTKQRELIFGTLLQWRDHPTADEVYARSREQLPGISLATVYNCLETLVGCGLVRAVNYEREPTRFCPNLDEHAHFQDRHTGRICDIELTPEVLRCLKGILPEGFNADSVDLYFHGTMPSEQSGQNGNK